MPYQNTTELPQAIKNYLPKQAQEIFCAAFNHALKQIARPQTHISFGSQEELAHRIAWAAVKKSYIKKDGQWQKKD